MMSLDAKSIPKLRNDPVHDEEAKEKKCSKWRLETRLKEKKMMKKKQ